MSDDFRGDSHVTNNPATPFREADRAPDSLTREEVDRLIADRLAERDREHEAEIAKVRTLVPQLIVPRNGGGPGNDNHRPSWSLAEQEAAARGDDLEHWHD